MAVTRGNTVGRRAAKREQIVWAAFQTLQELGYSRASTRAIATAGGFNQALIHYHFGSLTALWLEVVDQSSAIRMERYSAAVAEATTLEEMVAVATTIYREDLEGGHITVMTELIAGSLSDPELAAGLVERMQPWIAFVEDVIGKLIGGGPFEAMIPKRDAASALVAFYMGANLLIRLEPDRSTVDSMFETAGRFAPLLSPMLNSPN
jgi:AcrR family transcriptional regulator